MSSSTDLITRSKQLRVAFSCAFPTTSKVSANGFDLKDIVSDVLKEEQGYGEFTVNINLYKDQGFTQRLDNGAKPVEISVQDRIFFEVKLDSNDKRLTVFAENCSVTPTSNKKDERRYYLTKRGCKTDPTLLTYDGPSNAHRMSYESFTFVGVEDPITYLQCDVSICDNQAADRRCSDRKCFADETSRRSRRSSNSHGDGVFNHFYVTEKKHVNKGLIARSYAIMVHNTNRQHARRQARSVRSLEEHQQGIHADGNPVKTNSFNYGKLFSFFL